MDNSEAVDKLRAYLKCQENKVKGINVMCNHNMCDDCDLCYMQGTTGEHLTSIELAIQALEKLKEYQQLEEQGRLIKLPCKVGDIVYCIFNGYTKCTHSNEEFDEYNCQGCEYECDSKKENYVQDMGAYSLDWIVTNLNNFGKTVFLTREEAEAKLKELKGEENE